MKIDRMSVEDFVDAEKKRLTVFAKYRRQVCGGGQHTESNWRLMFAAHCRKGGVRMDIDALPSAIRRAQGDTDVK
jgi:hypothetical protein